MQKEILAGNPSSRIRLLAVNAIGQESGNDLAAAGQDIPLLQDAAEAGAWDLWMPTYRDVVIVDAENRKVGVYNLTTHDLNVPENYAELLRLLRDVAGE